MKQQKQYTHGIVRTLFYIFVGIYTLAAALVSLHRFWQYEVFYYDFGIYDQAIWNVAHFRPPIIDHFVIPGKIIFADHFNPSIFLLSPVYWFTSRPEALIIVQALAVGASALVLYALGRRLLKHDLASAAIVISYLLFVGIQNALIADIHEVTYMVLPLSLTLYGILTQNKKLFWISFFITLGYKESTALLGIAMAMLIYWKNPSWKKTAIVVGSISLLWGIATTQYFIPYFYGRKYFYTPSIDPNPFAIIGSFFNAPEKIRTLTITFGSFGFLPLLTPVMWPLIIQDLATRFMQHEFPLRWTLGLHYSTQMAVICAVSSMLSFSAVMRRIPDKRTITGISIMLIALSIFLHRFVTRAPLGLAYNPAFYQNTKNFTFLDDLLSRVPKGASVMTQNNLAPHLIHTNQVYLLRAVYDDFMPDYFVLDLREGQNFNDFFGADIEALKLTLPKDTRYEIYYQNGDQIIYKRIH